MAHNYHTNSGDLIAEKIYHRSDFLTATRGKGKERQRGKREKWRKVQRKKRKGRRKIHHASKLGSSRIAVLKLPIIKSIRLLKRRLQFYQTSFWGPNQFAEAAGCRSFFTERPIANCRSETHAHPSIKTNKWHSWQIIFIRCPALVVPPFHINQGESRIYRVFLFWTIAETREHFLVRLNLPRSWRSTIFTTVPCNVSRDFCLQHFIKLRAGLTHVEKFLF